MNEGKCAVPECVRPSKIVGICPAHYLRCKRHLAPGEVAEKLSAWKHGRAPWPEWCTKPFEAPRGQAAVARPAPPAVKPPPKVPENRNPKALQTTLPHSAPIHGNGTRIETKGGKTVTWQTEHVEPLRPQESRVLDPIMRRRVEGLRDTADYLARITDTSATRAAVLKVLSLGTIGVPVLMEEALQGLERAAKADGWIS